MIATGRPVSRAESRMRRITSACFEGFPCEKFNRATFNPAWISRVRISGDSDTGPIVATILVLCAGNAAFMMLVPELIVGKYATRRAFANRRWTPQQHSSGEQRSRGAFDYFAVTRFRRRMI